MKSRENFVRYENGQLVIGLVGSENEHEGLMRGLVQVLRGAYVEALNQTGGVANTNDNYVETVFNLLETLVPDEHQLQHGAAPRRDNLYMPDTTFPYTERGIAFIFHGQQFRLTIQEPALHKGYIGQYLQVMFNPGKMDVAYLFDRGQPELAPSGEPVVATLAPEQPS